MSTTQDPQSQGQQSRRAEAGRDANTEAKSTNQPAASNREHGRASGDGSFSKAREAVEDAVAGAKEKIEDTAGEVRDKATSMAEAVQSTVRENPMVAIGIALGVGLLVGMMLMQRRD